MIDLDELLRLHGQAFRPGVTLPLEIIKVMEEVPGLVRRLQAAEAENARMKHDLDAAIEPALIRRLQVAEAENDRMKHNLDSAIEALTVAGMARVGEKTKEGT